MDLSFSGQPVSNTRGKTYGGGTSGTGGGTSGTGGSTSPNPFEKWQPTPNCLNDAIQLGYHARFWVCDAQGAAASSHPSADSLTGCIVAETGRTGSANITDIHLEQYVNSNAITRNVDSFTGSMRIVEPMSAQLPDLMIRAARTVGITADNGNYSKCPWFLGIKFNGQKNTGSGGFLNHEDMADFHSEEYIWRIQILDFKTELTVGGCIHEIKFVEFNQIALMNAYCVLPESISFRLLSTATEGSGNTTNSSVSKPPVATSKGSGLDSNKPGTVGGVLNAIIDSFNLSNGMSYGYMKDMFQIKFIKYPSDAKYKPQTVDDTPGGVKFDSDVVSKLSTDNNQFAFTKGQSIQDIVDKLYSTYAETAKANTRSAESADQKNNAPEGRPPFVYRVYTEVDIWGFDTKVNDYRKVITYVVVPFAAYRGFINPPDVKVALSKEKIQQYMAAAEASNLCRKMYEYIFTGHNTEVVNLDLNFNFVWEIITSLYPAKDAGNSQLSAAYNDKVRQALTQRDQAQAALDNAAQQIRQQAPGAAQGGALAVQQQGNGLLGAMWNLSQQLFEQEQAARKGASGGTTNGSSYAEDNPEPTTAIVVPISIQKRAPYIDTQVSRNTPRMPDASRSIMSNLLNQLYATKDANLGTIQLQIRGDPYWFGHTNIEKPFEEDNTPGRSGNAVPTFQSGEHMFILYFKIPQGLDSNGAVKFNMGSGGNGTSTTEMFTGFYAVYQVNSAFEGGKFTQTLHAFRLAGWDYTVGTSS